MRRLATVSACERDAGFASPRVENVARRQYSFVVVLKISPFLHQKNTDIVLCLRSARIFMFGLLPRNLEFFDCFERSAQNAMHCAVLLSDLAKSGDVSNFDRVSAITEAEHIGDQITHETLDRLEQTYITPIDRDDIHRLITRIDDVVDTADAVAQRMMYYKITSISESFKNQCDVLVKATRLMADAVVGLRHMKDRGKKAGIKIDELIIAVHTAEEEGDAIHHKFLGELFESGLDAFQVIKWKELHELIEQGIDYCDDVACMVHGIMLKNV